MIKMVNLKVQSPELFYPDKIDMTPREFWESMGPIDTQPKVSLYRDEKGPFIASKVPMIIIMNGAGGTGKDTATDIIMRLVEKNSTYTCKRLSTVDKVYEAVNNVLLKDDTREDIISGISNKEDNWRQFMHEIKMTWTKYCDGPTQYILDTIYSDIKAGGLYTFYFIMIREVEEIKRFIEVIKGLTPYQYATVFVSGIKNADDWTNDCDHNVREELFIYDMTIHNQDSEYEMLEQQCGIFASRLINFYNTCNNIPVYKNRAVVEIRPNTVSTIDEAQNNKLPFYGLVEDAVVKRSMRE